MQLFVTDKGFIHTEAMKSKSEVPNAVKNFTKKIGAVDALVCDAAPEQVKGETQKFCFKIGTIIREL